MYPSENGQAYVLTDPVKMPKASSFLWNEAMMLHATCRGYVTAQFMQPEPSKYAHPPIMEAKTFILPEPSYYAHHPARHVYVKDEENGSLFSVPHEPVRQVTEDFAFVAEKEALTWRAQFQGIQVTMHLTLPRRDTVELWTITVKNLGGKPRKLSVYPYYTVGYMSWMNQGAAYEEKLQAVVASSVTPYQKYEDYAQVKRLKDKTFLWAQEKPEAWETSQQAFEGEGGLCYPDGIRADTLGKTNARYEMPVAVMQYALALAGGEEKQMRFVFGPAKNEQEIAAIIAKYSGNGFERAQEEYAAYMAQCQPAVQIKTPDAGLDNYINHWLPRQAFFHGMTNRLSTDPQTRNYIQDAMGMTYVKPNETRKSLLFALSQQRKSGEMPDGILLYKGAELKFINQVPHSDHCVWLPICLMAYLDETADYGLLGEQVAFADAKELATVAAHIDMAVDWLLAERDHRGLNYIRQGDWCDPMNAVGYKGIGVSAWLTMGTAYAARTWADICDMASRTDKADFYRTQAEEINRKINKYFWDGQWYARGITDDGVTFGVKEDPEGRVFLNCQSWAILCGAADQQKREKLMKAVEEQLESPYGAELVAPAYTHMREDIGRVTQKYPGTTENGSVYNHAAVFYIYALYLAGEYDHGYRLARKMLPMEDEKDIIRRGQLPVFIPNYYRGAYRQFPETAGRSSHLFCTGTISWYYRTIVEGMLGLKGVKDGLEITPRLPAHWQDVTIVRTFRGAEIHLQMWRSEDVKTTTLYCGAEPLQGNVLKEIVPGKVYQVTVLLQKR